MYFLERGDFESARQYIVQISKYHSNSLSALQLLINICVRYKNYPMARHLSLLELKGAPSSRAMINFGKLCLEMGRAEEGREYLAKALEFEDLSPQMRASIEQYLEENQ